MIFADSIIVCHKPFTKCLCIAYKCQIEEVKGKCYQSCTAGSHWFPLISILYTANVIFWHIMITQYRSLSQQIFRFVCRNCTGVTDNINNGSAVSKCPSKPWLLKWNSAIIISLFRPMLFCVISNVCSEKCPSLSGNYYFYCKPQDSAYWIHHRTEMNGNQWLPWIITDPNCKPSNQKWLLPWKSNVL